MILVFAHLTSGKLKGDVHSIHIAQGHILCTIRPVSGGIVYAAAPISVIFSLADELSSIQTSDSSLPLSIRSKMYFSVTVVRFDVTSGNRGSLARSCFLQTVWCDNAESPSYDAKIGNDIVVVKESSDRLLVWNWRTGEARVIQVVSTP